MILVGTDQFTCTSLALNQQSPAMLATRYPAAEATTRDVDNRAVQQ